ncbi:unnamed protein product [Caenorhabditis sp. 36 PRJEB53466]|nr:unnamed protein product [Caenorhabditis sp. 36 PRJEB53466]
MSVLLTILLRIAAEANGLLRRVALRGRRPSLLERTFELQENPLEPHGYKDRRWPQRPEEATERQNPREEAEGRADVLESTFEEQEWQCGCCSARIVDEPEGIVAHMLEHQETAAVLHSFIVEFMTRENGRRGGFHQLHRVMHGLTRQHGLSCPSDVARAYLERTVEAQREEEREAAAERAATENELRQRQRALEERLEALAAERNERVDRERTAAVREEELDARHQVFVARNRALEAMIEGLVADGERERENRAEERRSLERRLQEVEARLSARRSSAQASNGSEGANEETDDRELASARTNPATSPTSEVANAADSEAPRRTSDRENYSASDSGDATRDELQTDQQAEQPIAEEVERVLARSSEGALNGSETAREEADDQGLANVHSDSVTSPTSEVAGTADSGVQKSQIDRTHFTGSETESDPQEAETPRDGQSDEQLAQIPDEAEPMEEEQAPGPMEDRQETQDERMEQQARGSTAREEEYSESAMEQEREEPRRAQEEQRRGEEAQEEQARGAGAPGGGDDRDESEEDSACSPKRRRSSESEDPDTVGTPQHPRRVSDLDYDSPAPAPRGFHTPPSPQSPPSRPSCGRTPSPLAPALTNNSLRSTATVYNLRDRLVRPTLLNVGVPNRTNRKRKRTRCSAPAPGRQQIVFGNLEFQIDPSDDEFRARIGDILGRLGIDLDWHAATFPNASRGRQHPISPIFWTIVEVPKAVAEEIGRAVSEHLDSFNQLEYGNNVEKYVIVELHDTKESRTRDAFLHAAASNFRMMYRHDRNCSVTVCHKHLLVTRDGSVLERLSVKDIKDKFAANFDAIMRSIHPTQRREAHFAEHFTCTGVSILALHAQIGLYEEERVKLYQQLDEKNDEIQKVSQELEKLRQQVLLQEEALQTMRENEEIIREENSRIQREADDKQQEGKEMMTKNRAKNSVSILALHAQIGLYEEERVKLYQQLDEKNDEIQKVSQELEKLRQQVLLQEEALQTMRENEEIIREENSRIQREADDKQQEGKEMMTKNRAKNSVSILALHAQIGLYEEERVKLYQQLDEKNDEIQKVSQELEKLRQQVLLQEEALQTMRENEEIIREENSRIQREADDKQQEGKEMMTKNRAKNSVSILALHAQIGLYEEERVKLYQQLDEKNDEIQKVSQELEKLRQQVLLQEEALQTMRENEEIIREENSRIQREADDKQQEGKEMMTKNRAKNNVHRCVNSRQLDEKNDEIQKVSQELEKLRQQVLLQEEALQTMRENEEIIREENSRIQREADDKQQEGKEMMTKNRAKNSVSILALHAQIGLYEEERVKLYQQLDEKNDEIQKVSQELEKLRQQVLLQEEALQTMRENEEIIREENSRIQREADDKQQEGKEMMTKNRAKNSVSILALHAQIGLYEEERVKLYQQLDEKNDEIQKVSQELEKLRQQVLLQEEALQTMRENEEIIREENSRIQREADDKQQEGKEMMTKNRAKNSVSILALHAQIGLYEEERVKLYQQLDEKNDEIQKVSQELEKLRQQVLLQEEALQTMRENEEIIREENSRIQREADDKQQEGKEMMTKNRAKNSVSILALHAQIGLYEEEQGKAVPAIGREERRDPEGVAGARELRQQVLLQEEALQTMRENEEIIREENSRIQREADDKQQEGKEMMTKNRAKNRSDRVGGRRISPSTLRAQVCQFSRYTHKSACTRRSRVKLYQQLDEKNDEIQKVSQELEKLRQQVLLQEEALQTMRENEEIIREENSRIQREADDKQQEGKEMMTKNRAKNSVSILALHAQIGLYEEERVKLYQQLDEKNDEIQKVSQELEKLRQQVLLQEEALQTMRENEEIIREENSRIQREPTTSSRRARR